ARRSAIDRAAGEVGHARKVRRLVGAPGEERGVDRHGRRGAAFLRKDDDAVVEDVTRRRESPAEGGARHGRRDVGRNHPTVRASWRSRSRATAATWSAVTDSIAPSMLSK